MEPDKMHASDRSIAKSENFKLDDPAFKTSRHGAVDIGNHGSGCDRVHPRNAGAGTTGGIREWSDVRWDIISFATAPA